MADIELKKRYKYAGDIAKELIEHSDWSVESIIEFLNSIKDANVVEIKQGEWIICCDGYYPYCSLCGYEPKRPMGNYDNRTPYCPNCGAKMRKEWE